MSSSICQIVSAVGIALAGALAPSLFAESPAPSSIVLASGIKPPGPQASADENFLYELGRISQRYLLDVAYKPEYGNVYSDTQWSAARADGVVQLLQSPLATKANPLLVSFCRTAVQLDALLLKTADSFNTAIMASRSQSRMLMSEFLQKELKDLPNQMDRTAQAMVLPFVDTHDHIADDAMAQAFGLLAQTYGRVAQTKALLAEVRKAKEKGALHKRWAEILTSLSIQDASIVPYALEPRVTDPTWHFLRLREVGETFFGDCVSARGREEQAPVLRSPQEMTISGLDDHPLKILVSADTQGRARSFAIKLNLNMPPKRKVVFACQCEKGHFGILFGGGSSTWVARSMTDAQTDGRHVSEQGDTRNPPRLCHLITTGGAEDKCAKGTVLIYLQDQYTSDAEAAEKAKEIFITPFGD